MDDSKQGVGIDREYFPCRRFAGPPAGSVDGADFRHFRMTDAGNANPVQVVNGWSSMRLENTNDNAVMELRLKCVRKYWGRPPPPVGAGKLLVLSRPLSEARVAAVVSPPVNPPGPEGQRESS